MLLTIGRWVGLTFMALTGWRVRGQAPTSVRTVIIAAPHTTNWDFVYLMAAAMVLKVRIHWLGKKELFAFPFGGVMRALGGISVDRAVSTNLVEQVAGRFETTDKLTVVIPPSGTRGRATHWKSGFYWIAHNAGASIVCGYLDYAKREAGLGYTFEPSGIPAQDMPRVRAFYEPITGKYPDQTTPARLREESSDDAA